MKFIITVFILLSSLATNAQNWKERYVTLNGDTITTETTIIVVRDKTLSSIYPSPEAREFRDRFKLYLTSDVPGKSYKVHRLSRIKLGKGSYKYILTFKYYNKQMNKFNAAEYYVDIEDALKNGEIEIVEP